MEKKVKVNSNTSPLVSIIVITYNSSQYVLETLESVKNQTYSNIELIISDDGSQDNTIKTCEDWLVNNQNRFVHTSIKSVKNNTGIPANCNRGLKLATGKWIKFIAGDDALLNHCIYDYIKFIKINLDINIIHANAERYNQHFNKSCKLPDKNKASLKFNKKLASAEDQFQFLLRSNPIYAGTVFINKKVFDCLGSFNEKFKLCEDRHMWIKCTENGFKLHYIDKPMIKYRISNSSVQLGDISTKIFTNYSLRSFSYMLEYKKYYPLLERYTRVVEYRRRVLLDKLRLNKRKKIFLFLNFITGYFLNKIIYLKAIKYLK